MTHDATVRQSRAKWRRDMLEMVEQRVEAALDEPHGDDTDQLALAIKLLVQVVRDDD